LTDVPFTATCQTSYPPAQIAEYDWDFLGTGKPNVQSEKQEHSYTYTKSGTYKVTCKAIARNGNTSQLTKQIVVVSRNVKVKARAPLTAQALVPVEFDGEIQANRTKVDQVAWDYDGDNVFDWTGPSLLKTKHAYEKAGSYHAVLKATSSDKHEWFDTVSITVAPSIPPKAIAGKPVLAQKDQDIELAGKGIITSGTIILYEWDFDGDGTFDWKSDKTGTVHHKFVAYSHPVLRVTGISGLTSQDTTTVVICPTGMVGVKDGPFCIDKYEFPNSKGQVPVVNTTYTDAVESCKKEGKHLCTSQEWERACSGGSNQKYPVSSSQYAEQPCNVLVGKDHESKMAQSGSYEDCVSGYGAFDMNGNVAEWTAPAKNNMAFAAGGSWLFPQENARCGSKMELAASKGYAYVGFRCCK
jgi:hypothetical protein